ncbi:tetratricopeptide repeat protein [Dyella acidisoli]|uniref:Tetratricopeptide repeat protein n=1 Tax=Dyella acidisoli TaxID=1867834 RepID=A0ABQ5XQ78_9GAMM|nr:tetratricopeptide repeat protein [Dyella acidisoli]GLQ92653.1 hypothetical protein GCM10007901_16040 [Dyella acidisoli]
MNNASRCDSAVIDHITLLMQTSDEEALTAIDDAMTQSPSDARLHLLRGAMLAHQARYDEAITALSRAVVLNPTLHMARFMLGYLEIVGNRPTEAIAIFSPLTADHGDEAIRLFATGLVNLLENRLTLAAKNLQAGLDLSPASHPLGGYVHSVLEGIKETLGRRNDASQTAPTIEPGANHFLLADYLHRSH